MTAIRTGVAAAARCLALDQLTAVVLTALQQAGIVVVLLKGAGLAQRLYPDNPDRRRYSDVDLLVAPAAYERAEQVLAEVGLIDRSSGLREDELAWYERSWRLPGLGSLTVDLHRAFVGVQDPTTFWEVISANTEPLDVCGIAAQVPDAAGCALIVGLHAAVPGPGRKPLTDLTEALALLPGPVWDRAGRLARLTRSTDGFARGLSRHPAGEALLVRLQLTSAGTLADGLITRQVGGSAVSLARLLDVRGLRAKLRFVARHLFHSPALMRRCHPIARRGKVGLAAAYVLRAGRMVALAPTAVLIVRRARRNLEPPARPRHRSGLRAIRALVDLDGADRLTCLWTLRTLHRTRRQLSGVPLTDLDLARPPPAGGGGSLTVERVLAHQGANCLETALVMQRWLAAQGIARDLLIGVSAPGESFRAHAWLDDPGGVVDDFELGEIHRRPASPAWSTVSRPSSWVRRRARD